MSITFFWVFLICMLIGVPIVFALVFAPIAGFIIADKPIFLKMVVQRTFAGINQFPLLAIPFFILAGEVMNRSGITLSLVQFANALVGHLRGGLAQVNVLSSMLFAGISGSAVADTSAIGSLLIPAMEKDGYSRKFAAAITAASSVIGPVIPPSIIMVV
ncbi:MAG: TRAP transporter large permease subunit, partial [Gammaproteobacteria bacterium]|nr:TRAP transporter large permease subunit [Gammaproteobacteria bacterium]